MIALSGLNHSSKGKLLVIVGIVSTVAVVAIVVLFNFVLFRIKDISPDPLNYPTSSTDIRLTFTKEIDTSKKPSITTSPNILSTWNVKDSVMTISFLRRLNKDEELTITLTNITAKTGQTLNDTVKITAKYVDFSSLPAQEQQQQTRQSDSYEVSYPLVNSLPITTSEYDIGYEYPDATIKKMPIYITVKNQYPTPDNTTSQSDKDNYNGFLKQQQEAAYKQVTSLKDFDAEKYSLFFTEPIQSTLVKGEFYADYAYE